jgi:hypothetical protein
MHRWASAAITLAAAIWVLTVAAGAVSIYAFDDYEHAWGRGATVQVYSWVATGAALISGFGASLGFRYGSRNAPVPGRLGAVILGGLVLGLTFGATAALLSASELGFLYPGACIFVVALVVAYVSCRVLQWFTSRAV